MKNQIKSVTNHISGFSAILFVVLAFLAGSPLLAQETVEINGQDVGTWFQRNWMWVVGGVLLLLLIIGFSSRGSSRVKKTTTIVKDNYGNVKSVTTTEEKP